MTPIFLLVIGIVLVWGAVTYNRLVALRNRIDNAWAQIDVQLRRRHDLIPNLVDTVEGYVGHERGTLEGVVEARRAAVDAADPSRRAEAEGLLSTALGRLFALAEDYPELRASENFAALQEELGDTEDKIAVARQIYNDTALRYNTACQQVPTSLIASLFGFRPRPYFETDAATRAAPDVEF